MAVRIVRNGSNNEQEVIFPLAMKVVAGVLTGVLLAGVIGTFGLYVKIAVLTTSLEDHITASGCIHDTGEQDTARIVREIRKYHRTDGG